MQKVYKLKQWYPGLPEGWKHREVVVKIENDGASVPPYDFMNEFDFFELTEQLKEQIPNNPDFWELVQKTTWSLDEINEAIEKWKFAGQNEELLLVSELKSEFGL